MNYIKKLQAEARTQAAELAGLRAGLSDLRAYLTSSKFAWPETSVNTSDVLLRLDEADMIADNLKAEQETMNRRTLEAELKQ